MHRRAAIGLGIVALFAFGAAAAPEPLRPIGPPVNGAQQLALSLPDYEALRPLNRVVLPAFPLGSGAVVELVLERAPVFTDDARVVLATPDAELDLPLPDAQFFSGVVAGEPDSRVFLALSPHGTSGTIVLENETLMISSGPAGSMPTLVYGLSSPAGRGVRIEGPGCAGALIADGLEAAPAEGHAAPLTGVCRQYRIAIDCDTEFTEVLFQGNEAAAATYAATIVAGMNDMYRRDVNISFLISFLRLWIGPDPYTQSSASSQLTQFRSYWQNNMGGVQRNLANLFSGRPLGGGVAWLAQLCTSYSYAVNGNLSGFFPYPLQHNHPQNWDVMVVTHENGHIVGSGHTHEPNHYNPPIDGCGNAYLNPPLPQDCSVAQQGLGTIMSYCHLCAGGFRNVRMEMGPRVSQKIRDYIETRPSCGTLPSISISAHPQNATTCVGGRAEFNVSVTGSGPFTYQWRRNGDDLVGANGATLVIDPASPGDAGSYDCFIRAGCVTAESLPASLTLCRADFNCDGEVDFFDYLDFVQAFSDEVPAADFNGDGQIDFFDYLDFIAAFDADC